MFATSTHALIHTPIHFLREITTSNAIDMDGNKTICVAIAVAAALYVACEILLFSRARATTWFHTIIHNNCRR
jgi:hypothetical protein